MLQTKTVNELVVEIYNRLDSNSLVVQKDGDSGDQCYRSSIFAILLNLVNHPQAREYYEHVRDELSAGDNMYRRSADVTHWGFNPNNLSRDQAAALMLAASINGDDKMVSGFYKRCHNRWYELEQIPKYGPILQELNVVVGFHQNIHPGTDAPAEFRKVPDICGIGEVRNEIRRKKQWWKYPWLCFLDAGFLLDLKLRSGQSWDFDSLLAKDLIYANIRMATPFSRLAKKIYSKTNYIECIRNNYTDVNNGIEPLGELYELVCRKYINDET